MSVFEDQKKFMIACDQHVDVLPCINDNHNPTQAQAQLYTDLVEEEYDELQKATNEGDVVGFADGIIDTIVVLIGLGYSVGLPMQALWDEVIRSNMSKVMPDGKVHRREDGKVLKPDTFSPADIRGVLKQHGFDV